MNSIEERDSDSFRSSVSSPGMPNTCFTPSASRHSTKTSDALRLGTPVTLPRGPQRESEGLRRCVAERVTGGDRRHHPDPSALGQEAAALAREPEPDYRPLAHFRLERPRAELQPAPRRPLSRPGRDDAGDVLRKGPDAEAEAAAAGDGNRPIARRHRDDRPGGVGKDRGGGSVSSSSSAAPGFPATRARVTGAAAARVAAARVAAARVAAAPEDDGLAVHRDVVCVPRQRVRACSAPDRVGAAGIARDGHGVVAAPGEDPVRRRVTRNAIRAFARNDALEVAERVVLSGLAIACFLREVDDHTSGAGVADPVVVVRSVDAAHLAAGNGDRADAAVEYIAVSGAVVVAVAHRIAARPSVDDVDARLGPARHVVVARGAVQPVVAVAAADAVGVRRAADEVVARTADEAALVKGMPCVAAIAGLQRVVALVAGDVHGEEAERLDPLTFHLVGIQLLAARIFWSDAATVRHDIAVVAGVVHDGYAVVAGDSARVAMDIQLAEV